MERKQEWKGSAASLWAVGAFSSTPCGAVDFELQEGQGGWGSLKGGSSKERILRLDKVALEFKELLGITLIHSPINIQLYFSFVRFAGTQDD